MLCKYACSVLLLSTFLLAASSLTFELDPHRQQCFYDEVKSGARVIGSYEVSQGGLLDVDVVVKGPDASELFKKDKSGTGRFTFNAEASGEYSFCFSNKMSSVSKKTVSFAIEVGDEDLSTGTKGELARQEHIDPIEKGILKLSEAIRGLQAEQEYLKMRERAHRDTSESTNARVLWWSILEASVLVAMSMWQIYYLRRFFEVKTTI
uniref:GOLD domain-containing protein n=1 Tax=Palpitomonas bilix TaxID=652834 RepID=A0A7S3DHW7_9EUKA